MSKSIQQQIFDLQDSVQELEGQIAEKQGQINALTRNNCELQIELKSIANKVSGNRGDILALEGSR